VPGGRLVRKWSALQQPRKAIATNRTAREGPRAMSRSGEGRLARSSSSARPRWNPVIYPARWLPHRGASSLQRASHATQPAAVSLSAPISIVHHCRRLTPCAPLEFLWRLPTCHPRRELGTLMLRGASPTHCDSSLKSISVSPVSLSDRGRRSSRLRESSDARFVPRFLLLHFPRDGGCLRILGFAASRRIGPNSGSRSGLVGKVGRGAREHVRA